QSLVRIAARNGDHGRSDLGDDPELLVQLAGQGALGRLARLALAAGEFPQARQVPPFGAAGEEDAAAGVRNDGRDDVNHASWPWQCLNFLPLPQGHGSLRPTLAMAAAWACCASSSAPRPPVSACWNCICCSMRWACARSAASIWATSSSLRMRTRASRTTTSCLTLSSSSPNSTNASCLYSCLGCFCA